MPRNLKKIKSMHFTYRKCFNEALSNLFDVPLFRSIINSRVLKQATVDNFPVGVRWISGLI